MSRIFQIPRDATIFCWSAEESSCFWYTDKLSDDFAKKWSRITKDQLCMLKLYLRIPDVIITSHRNQFTGDEVLIMCLGRIA
jgi:hypothetical protein